MKRSKATSLAVADQKVKIYNTCFRLDEIPQAIQHFDENGFVVIDGIFTLQQCNAHIDRVWSVLETCLFRQDNGENLGIRRDDPQTWNNDRWSALGYLNNGQTAFLPQTAADWMHRDDVTFNRVFGKLLEAEFKPIKPVDSEHDLSCSFDVHNLYRPNYDSKWRTQVLSPHFDQGRTNSFINDSIQCLINFTDATPTTGGFLVYPKSNRHFRDFYSMFPSMQPRDDLVMPLKGDLSQFANAYDLEPHLVTATAGSAIFWKSTTLHGNVPYLDQCCDITEDLIRVVKYDSRDLKSRIPSNVMQKRKEAFESGKSTSHWVTKLSYKKTVHRYPKEHHIKSTVDRGKIDFREQQRLLGDA